MSVTQDSEISCSICGFTHRSDDYGFLHNETGIGEELRYVSDWSRRIYDSLYARIDQGAEQSISCKTQICMVDDKRHKFMPVGEGTVTLMRGKFLLEGTLGGAALHAEISIAGVPTLPFSPGKYLEIQDGGTIYRCVLEDGKLVMKFINMLKIFYDQNRIKEKASC